MRIVYCIDELCNPGGIGRITAVKANWFAKKGHEVWIVTFNQDKKNDFYELDPHVKRKRFFFNFQLGIDNDHLLLKAIRKIGKMRRFRRELKSFIYEIKPDITISTFTNESEFLYKFKDGSKKILEFHFSHDGFYSQIKYGPHSLKHVILTKIRLWKHEYLAKKYDIFVVLTNEDAHSWNGYNNLKIIPNMCTLATKTLSTCENKKVIAIGRLDFQKNFSRLIKIWNAIHKMYPNWTLEIYGEGPEKLKLTEQIYSLGLADVIKIQKPSPHIEHIYQEASILAMTSCYEGWGLVLTEAMSYGIPCIAYACKCGPRDIIDNEKNGFLVEEDNESDYIKKLSLLMSDTEFRKKMGVNAKIKSQKYSTDKIMNQWNNLFTSLL